MASTSAAPPPATPSSSADDSAGRDDLTGNRLGAGFTTLWAAGAATSLGVATTAFAIPLLVLALSGSARTAGLVATTSAAAATLAHLPAGALADRLDRRRLLLTSHSLRAALAAALALAVATGNATVALVAVITTAAAVLAATTTPAEHAAIAQLVRTEHLPHAYARNEARLTAASMAGPPLGGVLYSASRAAPFALDALCHAVAYLLLRRLPPLRAEPAATLEHPLISGPAPAARTLSRRLRTATTDVADGLAHVARTPFLRAVVLITAPASAALAALTFTATIALRQGGTPPALIGAAMSTLGVAAVVGALAGPALVRRLRLRPLLIATTAMLLVGSSLASLLTGDLFMVAPLTLAYLLTPGINTALLSRFAVTTPHRLQGRVLSAVYLASGALGALAPVTAGWLITTHGATSAAAAAAAVLLIPLAATVSSRALRL